jgi:hypothetical protein
MNSCLVAGITFADKMNECSFIYGRAESVVEGNEN